MTYKANPPTMTIGPEALEAAHAALCYAVEQAQRIAESSGMTKRIAVTLIDGLLDLRKSMSKWPPDPVFNRHLIGATGRLNKAVAIMGKADSDEEKLAPILQATERALNLLNSMTHVSRRQRPVRSFLPVFEVNLTRDSETNFFTGFTGDIDSGGLFIATYNTLPIESPILVKLRLSPKHRLTTKAKVSWVREYSEEATETDVSPGIGVIFDTLTPKDRQAINRYIGKKAPLFYEAV